MKFIFDDEASKSELYIRGDTFKYLFKVRRHLPNDILEFRNPKNPAMLYSYKVSTLESREAKLALLDTKEVVVQNGKKLHLLWCIIDPKEIEKVLANLCEIGVSKISFIYCKRSQKSYKIDLNRLKRLEIASMQQCGRSTFMEYEILKDLKEAFKKYDNITVFDFSENLLDDYSDTKVALVGCEGGFSDEEKKLFNKAYRFKTPLILRSQSAVVAISSKVLL